MITNDIKVDKGSQQSPDIDPFDIPFEDGPIDDETSLEIRRYYQAVVKPGQIVEIRCLDALMVGDNPTYNKPRVIAGWFDNVESIISEVRKIARAAGIYMTINPCLPDLLARANNQLKSGKLSTTSDNQIVVRQILPIDIDSVRLAGIPASNTEHQSALTLVQTIRDTLKSEGWPDPINLDSGNGAYLEYAIALPTQDEGLIQRVLQGIANRFDTEQAHIDTTTYNPARIMRLPGTMNRKGDGTENRPHRMARIIHVPDAIQIVTREQLEAIAIPVEQPKQSSKKSSSDSVQGNEWLENFIAKHAIQVTSSSPYNGGVRYQLPVCVWNAEHNDHCMCVYYDPNHGYGAKCSHNSCKGKGWKDFRRVFEPDFDKKAPKSSNLPDLPQFIIEGQMREQVQDALNLLKDSNTQNPLLFIYLSMVSKVAKNEHNEPIIKQVDRATLRNELNNIADFFKQKTDRNGELLFDENDDPVLVTAQPPKDIADQMLALAPNEWPLPALRSIVEAPVLRPDGSILNTPGYDPSTQLYYVPGPGMGKCKIPENPTQQDAIEAMNRLKALFTDFPFEGDADKANTLALLLTPFVRHAVKKDIQMALIDATNAGTGKGLITIIISIIATGKPTTPMSAKQNDEEWRKALLTELLQAPRIVIIDNIRGILESAALELILTGGGINERILGQSKSAKARNEATFMATGNNLLIGGDLPRRCMRIRLISQTANPEERDNFKIADLEQHAIDNRPQIVSDILTVCRAWYAADKPKPKGVPNLGTFTDWAKTVGGMLEFAGIEGFQANRDELRSQNNEEAQECEAFLSAWQEIFKDNWKHASDIVAKITKDSSNEIEPPANLLFDALPKYLRKALADKPRSFDVTLSRWLGKRVQTVYGSDGFRIEKQLNKNSKTNQWRVVRGVTGGSPRPSQGEPFSSDYQNNRSVYDIGVDWSNPPQPTAGHNDHISSNGSTSGFSKSEIFSLAGGSFSNADSSYHRLPNRACYECRTQNWEWNEVLDIAVCLTCKG